MGIMFRGHIRRETTKVIESMVVIKQRASRLPKVDTENAKEMTETWCL